MKVLTEEEQRAVAQSIVRDFGDGSLRREDYLFDQIIGSLGIRLMSKQAVGTIKEEEVIVLLDKHANNIGAARQVMDHLGVRDAWRMMLPRDRLREMLRFIECDLYVTTTNGRLLLVACHEDDWKHDDRTVWVPVPGRDQ